MPSLGDSAVIIFLGLLLFGPKGLAKIARQLGKLMGEFRRASNEFRMQMEEELRVSEQADRQKEIAAIEAAAPPTPVLASAVEESVEEHPHLRAAAAETLEEPVAAEFAEPVAEVAEPPAPVPIALSGELSIMPPATGLPSPRKSSLSALIESVPRVDAPNGHGEVVPERPEHTGLEHTGLEHTGLEQRPMRYTNGHDEHVAAPVHDSVDSAAAAESVHG